MKFNFRCLSTLLVLFMCFGSSAEKIVNVVSTDDAKAHYLLEIIKHITPKTNHNPIVIGMIGNNEPLFLAIKKKIQGVKVRNTPLFLELVKTTSPITKKFSVLFLANKRVNNIKTLFEKFGTVLIVVDGRVQRESQLANLVTSNGQVKIAINRENLVNYGFKVSNSLLNFAGTKEDLSNQLKEQKAQLNKLIIDAQNKRVALDKTNKMLAQSNQSLSKVQQALTAQQQALKTNKTELEKSHKRLLVMQQQQIALNKIEMNKASTEKYQQKLNKKIRELTRKEAALSQVNEKIEATKAQLEHQQQALSAQSKVISQKEKMISGQRTLLYVATAAIFLISLFVYLTLKLSFMYKRANKKLTKLNKELYELATTDGLTHIFNRRHFFETAQLQLSQLIRTHDAAAMLMLDIDKFKAVNDTYGHAMGDIVIRKIAELLQHNSREYDIVGRVGGEEYAMMLTQCDQALVKKISERIRKTVEELPISFRDNTINVTISIGFTMIDQHDTSVEKILQRADTALYHAKSSGRNKVKQG